MKRIEKILTACLDDIESGTTTIEECLERHRELRDELEPLLRLAADIEKLPPVAPSAAFRAQARANLMEYTHDRPVKRGYRQWLTNIFVQPGWARAGAIVLAIAVVLAGSGAGTAYAAESSLPGDLLYPVKTGTESLREWFEADAAADASLQIEFASRRIEEIERLIEKSSPDISIAVAGYENNLNKALIYERNASAVHLSEEVALAIENQLNRLYTIEDASGVTDPGIIEAEEIAVEGHVRSLGYLAETGPIRASELTITSMQNRLNRAAAAVANGNTAQAENALRHFARYAGLGEEIRDSYAGTGTGTSIDSLFQQAGRNQQPVFASFSSQVSPQIASEVQMAFQRMERNRGQESGNPEPGTGSEGQEPNDQGQGPGAGGEEPGGGGQEPGSQEPEPGSGGQEPGNAGEEPDQQGQEPGNQGQGAGNGGGESPGMPTG